MDAIAEYLIKSEDFSKVLATLLKENVVDKIIGAQLRVDKKSGNVDRFTVQPKLVEKEEVQIFGPRGKDAGILDSALGAVEGVAAQFRDVFKESGGINSGAAKSFKEGAEALQDAMNTGSLKMVVPE